MDRNKKDIFCAINLIFLAAVHIFILIFIVIKLPYHIDSDMASEMILGKLLKENGGIITDEWYYSTEIRVINTQLVYKLLFYFTDNWRVVRVVSCLIFHLLLTFSAWYISCKLKIKKWFPFIAAGLLIPLNSAYYYIMLMGCYYVPHVLPAFISLGLAVGYSMDKQSKTRSLIPALLFAFVFSLEGIRMTVVCFAPLFLTAVLMAFRHCYANSTSQFRSTSYFRLLVISAACLAAAGAGYLFNSNVMSEFYYFERFDEINFTGFNLERLSTVLSDMLVTFGFSIGKITATSAIGFMISGILLLSTVIFTARGIINWKSVSPEYAFISVFLAANAFIFVAIYTFTDMGYTSRYNFLTLIFAYPVIAIGLKELDFGKLPRTMPKITAVIFGGILLLGGALHFNTMRFVNRTRGLLNAAKFLENSGGGGGYTLGYGTFWNANVLTELTNGKVEMYAWNPPSGLGESGKDMSATPEPDALFPFLQTKSHITNQPEGRIFLIFDDRELTGCPWRDRLSDENVVYSAEGYTIYEYEGISELKK